MATKIVIMFPYGGFKTNEPRCELFWELVKTCHEVMPDQSPIVILNKDTEKRKQADAFLHDQRYQTDLVEVYKTWSVDTCQMWLTGWGYVIDKYKEKENVERIVLLPGDIDAVGIGEQKDKFFSRLEEFISFSTPWDIIIGDFTTTGRFNAKDLIDQYGTYALMANWFPEIVQKTLKLPLNRPRSEFLNIKIDVLQALLAQRKFAYEQTLNILIQAWDFQSRGWKYKIHIHDLGNFTDDSGIRRYMECVNQIERTERMLKLLWREKNEPSDTLKYQKFIDQYHNLDLISTAIRENSRIIIRNLLGVAG